ncbi:hypothetical protein IPH92_03715 [Candidatus Kaiserbacteria bacterium]|nr:MAG: hypothetical protein IPH92_03715 [Candidatus Kaiserbacteria bacterium]
MEGISRVESAENTQMWRELKEQAPEKAKEIIAGISDFETMDADEQCAVLEAHIDKLVDDNKNRYLAKELTRNVLMIRGQNEFDNRMRSLAA